MTRSIRGFACALVLALGAFVAGAQSSGVQAGEEGWLARFNGERAARGMRPLLSSPVLDQVAQAQAEEMARERDGLREVPAAEIAERLRRAGYSAHDWRETYVLAGLATRAVSVEREARCRAMLDGHFRDLGVGVAATQGRTFYVFLFAWHQGAYFADATAGLDDRARVEAEMLARINDVRRRQGLAPLAASPPRPGLPGARRGHAAALLLRPPVPRRARPHRAGAGRRLPLRNRREHRRAASTAEALEARLASPGHRRNILDPDSREMGLGSAIGAGYDAAPGGYRVVWVQSFGRGSRGTAGNLWRAAAGGQPRCRRPAVEEREDRLLVSPAGCRTTLPADGRKRPGL